MMQKVQFVISICLMAVVLMSSTGFELSQHWCGDRMVNATLFGEAAPCNHFVINNQKECPMHTKSNTRKKCCDQRCELIEGNNYTYEFQSNELQLSFNVVHLLVWDFFVEKPIIKTFKTSKYFNHSPPLLASETAVLFQTFLI
jgi:hypothetical protein